MKTSATEEVTARIGMNYQEEEEEEEWWWVSIT
jgi:hypothetical protein